MGRREGSGREGRRAVRALLVEQPRIVLRYGLKGPAEAGSNDEKANVCLELPDVVYSTRVPAVPTDEDTDEESARTE